MRALAPTGFSLGFGPRIAAKGKHIVERIQRITLDKIGQTGITKPLYAKGFRKSPDNFGLESGGEGGTRTPDPVIMSHVL